MGERAQGPESPWPIAVRLLSNLALSLATQRLTGTPLIMEIQGIPGSIFLGDDAG